jgi:hypothetical protein
MDIEEIIKEYINPRIEDECKRLGISREFIIGVYSSGYSFDSLASGDCTPVIKDGKIIGVKITLDRDETRTRGARESFFHEMKHAWQFYNNILISQFEAYLYMMKREIQEDYKTCINTLKKYLFSFKNKNLSYFPKLSVNGTLSLFLS